MISTAIPTYGRTEGVEEAISSILRDPAVGELIVVDQNTDGLLDEIFQRIDDPRLRRLQPDQRGAGRARNAALRAASGDVLCLIDDDCVAPIGWAEAISAAMADSVGCVFTNVVEPPGTTDGFTPTRRFAEAAHYAEWRRSPSPAELGIGASYAVRVEAALAIGGWDETMGPGGRFPSADDIDIAYRMLLAGWDVCCSPAVDVVHHGTRDGAELRALNKRDYHAAGAMYAKLARVRPLPALAGGARFVGRALLDSVGDTIRTRRPAGIGRWFWTAVGFGAGLRLPVDKDTMTFRGADA